jgi:signal transduction histidine kinase
MPDRTTITATYAAFLRSRWPSRTRQLSVHAFLGTFVLMALDWIFTRRLATPPGLGELALLRLPWAAVPVVGWLLAHRAPGWRHLPAAVVGLSVTWTWAAVLGYFAIGLEGSVPQAITLFACLVTTAALMPLSQAARAGTFALMALGYVAFDLSWPHRLPLSTRLADDVAVLAYAVIQILVFQSFANAREKSVVLRHRLEKAVADSAASRQRAADAVAEVGRLAAEVAHEVNNPLAAVKVNVRWLATEGAQPTCAAERAEVGAESLEAVDRIGAIVQTLKRRAADEQAALGVPGPPAPPWEEPD